jgi:hypothetical protein
MKAFTALVLAIALLGAAGDAFAQSSRNARESATTAQLNRQQLADQAQQAQMPASSRSVNTPMMAPTTAGGKVVPPGARCGNDNPSCAQQLENPSVNSASQLRLYQAQ